MRETFIFPNIPALVNLLELWLQRKALQGWRLEHSFGWSFTFRQCKPYKTRYFIYSRRDKSSGFSHLYYRAEKRYSRKKSKLKSFRIFEVDIDKIDSDFDFYVSNECAYQLDACKGCCGVFQAPPRPFPRCLAP